MESGTALPCHLELPASCRLGLLHFDLLASLHVFRLLLGLLDVRLGHLVVAAFRIFIYSCGLDCIFGGSRRACQSLGRRAYVLRHGLVPRRALTVIHLFHEAFPPQGA